MEDRTADQLLQDYTAMGHSVALIADVIAGNSMAEEDAPTRQSCVDRNVQHLELMRAKDDWGSEDMAPITAAITAATNFIAA